MKIDKEFARYILGVQGIAIVERDEYAKDVARRRQIYDAFPELEKEHERHAFEEWLWLVVCEQDEGVQNVRTRIKQHQASTQVLEVGSQEYLQGGWTFQDLISDLNDVKMKVRAVILTDSEKHTIYWARWKADREVPV